MRHWTSEQVLSILTELRLDARDIKRATDGRFGDTAGTHHKKVKPGKPAPRKKATDVEKSRSGLRAAVAAFKADPSEANRASVKTASEGFAKSLQGQSPRALAKSVKTAEPDAKPTTAPKQAKPKVEKAPKVDKQVAAREKLQAQLKVAADKEKAHQEKVRAYKEAHFAGDEKGKKALKLGVHAKQQAEREIEQETRIKDERSAKETQRARVMDKLGGDKFSESLRSDDQKTTRTALREGIRKEFPGLSYKGASGHDAIITKEDVLMPGVLGSINGYGLMTIAPSQREKALAGDLEAVSTYVHEELHGHGPQNFGESERYKGAGAVTEEVVTEVLARKFTERPMHAGSYQKDIDATVDAFRKAGAPNPEASLLKAAMKYKQSREDFDHLNNILADSADDVDRGLLKQHLSSLRLSNGKAQ